MSAAERSIRSVGFFFPLSPHRFCGSFYMVGFLVERFLGFIIVGFDIREVGRFGFWRSD